MKGRSPNLLSSSADFRDPETLIRGRILELVDVIFDQELNSALGPGAMSVLRRARGIATAPVSLGS